MKIKINKLFLSSTLYLELEHKLEEQHFSTPGSHCLYIVPDPALIFSDFA